MSALSFFGYAIMVAISPVIAIVATRWFRRVVSVVKALRVLSRERRTGESFYDCAEAIAGDAHNWRGMVVPKANLPMTELSYRQAEGRVNRHGQDKKSCIVFLDPSNGDTVANATVRLEIPVVAAPDGYVLTEDWNLASIPQPPPVNESGPALWPLIISELGDSEIDKLLAADMQARHEFGITKYGVPLVASNGRDPLTDAYQEALDFVVYLRAAFDEDSKLCHEHKQAIASGVIATERLAYKAYARGSKIHALYLDAIDMARDVRELIRERDGK